MSTSISIIIPTRNRNAILSKTISALSRLAPFYSMEVIIVNDSEEELPRTGDLDHGFVRIIRNTRSGNAARSRNLGAAEAKNELLLFIDDDIIINKESLDFALELHRKDPKKLLNINWTYPEELIEQCKKNPFGRFMLDEEFFHMKGWRKKLEWKDDAVFEVEAAASFFLLISKEAYFSIGGFNEDFPFAGGEDIDFSRRVQEKGFSFLLNTSLLVYHNEEDRIIPEQWLQRKFRSGITFAVASSHGYKEYTKTYTLADRIKYALIGMARPFVFWYIRLNKGPAFLDAIYKKALQTYLYYYLQKGWNEGLKKHIA